MCLPSDKYALDTVFEELQPAGSGEVIVAQSGGVAVLQELQVLGKACLLDGLGRVPKLRDEVGDERELGHERVPRTVPMHLYDHITNARTFIVSGNVGGNAGGNVGTSSR